ncbi:hypothetical protein XENOCAPTIV_024301 [Xenoophorus captivus]|uniref:MHC class I antigen n=1 Tax=Xenoophorus captivus TaxID=1517983 RepID=A0ABV0SBB2_9TELE
MDPLRLGQQHRPELRLEWRHSPDVRNVQLEYVVAGGVETGGGEEGLYHQNTWVCHQGPLGSVSEREVRQGWHGRALKWAVTTEIEPQVPNQLSLGAAHESCCQDG